MRVLVAMSGGVDSSVAAALLRDDGHDVTGVTLKLWGGESDTGCCSVADVDDARRVAQQLGIEHHVFNFGDDFDRTVVAPYVAAHVAGRTPNPCVECNRHVKFDKLLRRADALGFDAVATGHHARVVTRADGTRRVARSADTAKDQSYVLHMLDQRALERVLLPLGDRTKAAVRAMASALALRTAGKPDSQDVCFITSSAGRSSFLASRMAFHAGRVVDDRGDEVGTVPAVELVTVGQRKGLGLTGGAEEPRYVLDVDVPTATITVGPPRARLVAATGVSALTWADRPWTGAVSVQCSAHGAAAGAWFDGRTLLWREPHARVAPGQSVVLYDGDEVVGGGLAA